MLYSIIGRWGHTVKQSSVDQVTVVFAQQGRKAPEEYRARRSGGGGGYGGKFFRMREMCRSRRSMC